VSSFEYIALPPRPDKPRNIGLTMVLDKDLGIASMSDFLESVGEYVDIVKFGWGTARILPREILVQKIELLQKHNVMVCPGGTLTEIAYLKNCVDRFLAEAKELGIDCIEISDGTVPIPRDEKLDLIRRVKGLGFTAFSEIGKKFEVEDRRLSIEERVGNALEELEAGSFKVIIEARETGIHGIFDEEGRVIPQFVERLATAVGSPNIIFEAPLPAQQEWLISNLGNTVNLGNIGVHDCLNLETLRCGLRAGTLREYHSGKPIVFIENGIPGALHAANNNSVIVVVDALRASTTIIAALASGIKTVRPVSSVDECVGDVTAGERGGTKVPNLTYDNSPLQIRNGAHKTRPNQELVLTSTNGTECIKACCVNNSPVLIGSIINARAVAKRAMDLAISTNRNITIVMAGRNNQLAVEDLISASEIVDNMKGCSLKGYIRPVYSRDYAKDFMESDSGKNLISLGKKDDVLFCAQKDVYDIVPEYGDGVLFVNYKRTS